MRSRRILVLLVVLLVAVLAAAQDPENPDGPTSLRDSECYQCHTVEVVAGPQLVLPYAIRVPLGTEFPVDETTEYRIEVANPWTAAVYDLIAVMDISEAPALGFASDQDPVHRQEEATLATAVAETRAVQADFEVPAGATDVRFRLVPAAQESTLAPDLTLHLWPPGRDPATSDPIAVDDTGNGGTEVFHIQGGADVASLGVGTWNVEAWQDVTGDAPASLTDQDVTFFFDAWSNVTGEVRQVQSSDVRLGDKLNPDLPGATNLTWRLKAIAPPTAEDRITLTVNGTLHWTHSTGSSEYDTWRFTRTVSWPLGVDGASPTGGPGPSPTTRPDIGDDGDTPPPPPPPAIPWARIGEIVGYVSAFLLPLSMLTGGVFGKASRRGLNKVFGTAKRRVAFHNLLSYLLTFVAAVHTGLFIWEPGFRWTLGIIWGGGAILAMLLLGVTGAFQVPLIRSTNFGVWRWTHFWLGIAALVLTVVHILLDGVHFTDIAEAVGWQDPLA